MYQRVAWPAPYLPHRNLIPEAEHRGAAVAQVRGHGGPPIAIDVWLVPPNLVEAQNRSIIKAVVLVHGASHRRAPARPAGVGEVRDAVVVQRRGGGQYGARGGVLIDHFVQLPLAVRMAGVVLLGLNGAVAVVRNQRREAVLL